MQFQTLRVLRMAEVLNVSDFSSSTTLSCPSRSLADRATWPSEHQKQQQRPMVVVVVVIVVVVVFFRTARVSFPLHRAAQKGSLSYSSLKKIKQ